MGIGTKLEEHIVEISKIQKVNAVYLNTSVKAVVLINWFLKAGWQKVGFRAYGGTNYYSAILRLPINGRKYSNTEAFARYHLSRIVCKIFKKENGEWRILCKFGKNCILLLKKVMK